MANRTVTSVLTLAFAALTLGVSGCAELPESPEHGSSHATSAHPSPAPSTVQPSVDAARQGDIAFAEAMIPHHKQAVEMSVMAQTKSSAGPAVKAMAAQIATAQQPEIDTMGGWLREWGVPLMEEDHRHATMPGMVSAADMTALKALEGPQFDQKWLTLMITHHQGAIDMAQKVSATTKDPAVKKLASAIVLTQAQEISQMRDGS